MSRDYSDQPRVTSYNVDWEELADRIHDHVGEDDED